MGVVQPAALLLPPTHNTITHLRGVCHLGVSPLPLLALACAPPPALAPPAQPLPLHDHIPLLVYACLLPAAPRSSVLPAAPASSSLHTTW